MFVSPLNRALRGDLSPRCLACVSDERDWFLGNIHNGSGYASRRGLFRRLCERQPYTF